MVKIGAMTKKVLWVCSRDGETFIMYPPLKSNRLCGICHKSMTIEKVVD